MSNKISEKTMVPLYAATAVLVFACGGAWTTAGLIADMKSDIRDLRKDVKLIKKHDHIPDVEDAEASPHLIESAEAGVKK